MLTRCPHCQTRFRVTPEQLKARQGQVRCGACQRVFDALDSLADEAASPPQTPVSASFGPEAATVEIEAPPPEAPATSALAEPVPPPRELPPVIEPPEQAEAEAPLPVESRRSQDGEEDELLPATETVGESLPAEWESVPATPPARRWPWIGGSLALTLAALLQLVFIFRVELAVLAPGLRPALAAGSALLGSPLPYPRKPELIGIEASDLAPAGAERLLLTAMLKNRAPFEQEYPHLELALTDGQDEALVRKVLAPADYLPTGQPPPAGFAARTELAVKLTIEAPGVPAVGYRLYLFYP